MTLSVPSSFFNSQTLSPPKPSLRSTTSLRFSASTVRASAAAGTTSRTTTSYLNDGGFRMAAASSSFYEILGIPAAASDKDIKAAYRKLARVCHPDVAAIDRKSSSADEFMRINKAYSTLSDPAKRADYDRRVLPPHRRRPSVVVVGASGFYGSGGYSRRSWETDQCW